MADGDVVNHGRRGAPFRCGEAVACPDCEATNWLIGRRSAECAACGAALPLISGGPLGAAAGRLRKGQKGSFRPARA